jgi:subtilisin family serine protease
VLFAFVLLPAVMAATVSVAEAADVNDKKEIRAVKAAVAEVGPGVRKAVSAPGGAPVIVTLRLNSSGVISNAQTGPQLDTLRDAVTDATSAALASLPEGAEARRDFDYIPAIAVDVADEAALDAILALPEVLHVGLNRGGSTLLSSSVPAIDADERHAIGNDGDGVTVVVMDTGVDSDHPDIADDMLTTNACFGDDDGSIDGNGFCPNGSDRQTGAAAGEDDEGHGTHVAGIVTSNGTQAAVGSAPGAEIISIKMIDSSGFYYYDSEVLAGWDWVIDNNSSLGIDVINMSFGGGPGYTGDCDGDYPAAAAAIATLRSIGVTPVAAAGNSASAEMTHPACLGGIIAVGASDNFDNPAGFTDSSTTTDVFAPGVGISSSNLGGGTVTFSGTSMASPHTAGCAALLIESGDATTPAAIEAALESSAFVVSNNGQVYPRIDCGVGSSSVCPPDDSLEDNDTLATATVVGSVATIPAIGCDDDYYAFPANSGDGIDVNLSFLDDNGNLDLGLYDPSGTLVASSASTTDNESVSHTAASTGTYTARVYTVGGDTNSYNLAIDASPTICPPDDIYEDNDTQGTATATTVGSSLSGVACDDDWYEFPLGAGDVVDLDLLFSNAIGDLDMELYDSSGAFLTGSASTTDNESISYIAAVADTYSVVVYGYLGAENLYDLDIASGVDPCGTDDPYEENDIPTAAHPLTAGVELSGIACDDDWFSISVTSGDVIDADLSFLHDDGDLDFELYDPSDINVAGSYSESDNESIVHTATETGVYTLLVYGYLGAVNDYDIVVSTGETSFCDGQEVTVFIENGDVPTPGDDVILGTAGDDVIFALDGDDTVCALAGDDTVVGGPGNDVVYGDEGNDLLSGNAGNDQVFGGPDRDRAYGGSGTDIVRGEGGGDTALGGGSGSDEVYGDGGGDVISGGSDDDIAVLGGFGNDAVNGGSGDDDLVSGDQGNDSVSGNGGADKVYGGEGDDTVRGGPGNDEVYGEEGDDVVSGNDGIDLCDGGPEIVADVANVNNCETIVNVP